MQTVSFWMLGKWVQDFRLLLSHISIYVSDPFHSLFFPVLLTCSWVILLGALYLGWTCSLCHCKFSPLVVANSVVCKGVMVWRIRLFAFGRSLGFL
jgi:hypothetical protein